MTSKGEAPAAPTTPRRLTLKKAALAYKNAGPAKDEWHTLASAKRKERELSVGPVIFDNNVIITQRSRDDLCTFKLSPGDYELMDIVPGETPFVPFTIMLRLICESNPHCDFTGEQAKEFPLAKLSSSFTKIKFMVTLGAFVGVTAKAFHIRERQLRFLMKDPGTPSSKKLSSDDDAERPAASASESTKVEEETVSVESLEQRMAAVKAQKEVLFQAIFEKDKELEELNIRLRDLERRR